MGWNQCANVTAKTSLIGVLGNYRERRVTNKTVGIINPTTTLRDSLALADFKAHM